jgi:error-prone DNA polymerase
MHTRAPKGEGQATWQDIADYAGGLVALVSDLPHAEAVRSIFGRENAYVEIQRHLRPEQERTNRTLIDYAHWHGLPLLATNGVRYGKKSNRALFDVLTCLRHKTVLDQAGRLLDANAERHLKSPAVMARLFRDLPEAVRNTQSLAGRLEFTLEDLGYEFPHYPVPPGETEMSYLRQRTFLGAENRYRNSPHRKKAWRQLEHELNVIEKLKLAGYFLIVWDMVEFCRREKILVQGRGSAANSAVCYSLGITAVDPVGMELLFERFLSEERGEWPDIDIDLPSGDQRERTLQHVYEQYGPRGAGMTANVITYRGKSAVRDVGKTLGFPEEMLGRLAKCISTFEYTDDADKLANQVKGSGFDVSHPRVHHLVRLAIEIQNLPRHLGQHSGGMVICQGDLDAVVPLENARMPGRVVVQWDKDDCADLKIIKVDLLGLGMMAALEETIEIIRSEGGAIDLAHLPPDDPKTYNMIQKADTVGVFQIESRAQMATLPRLKPQCFYDLVVEVAIIRPGPITGNMVHPYINRRLGREKIVYPHPSLEPILKRTLGVPLFQEQLLRLAMVAAGFSGGEAEELRRAMGFKRSVDRMREIEQKLRRGLASNGIHGDAAEEIVRSITSFALYGFPESHAASFALLAYASSYLKAHYPAEFLTALLNCQPMGFYSPAVLVKDAQRHGVRVRPIDVSVSDVKCKVGTGAPACTSPQSGDRWDRQSCLSATTKENAAAGIRTHAGNIFPDTGKIACATVRLGLRYVSGLRAEGAQRIEHERRKRPFASIEDFVRRTQLRKSELDVLAEIGALNSLGEGMHRRAALWQIEKAWRPKGPLLESHEEEQTEQGYGPQREGATKTRQQRRTAGNDSKRANSERAPNADSKIPTGTAPQSNTASQSSSRPQSSRAPKPQRSPAGDRPEQLPLLESPLAPMTPIERLDADYRGAGMTTGPHPMHYLREPLDRMGVLRAAELENIPHGRRVRVAGAVITRQRPGTAKGVVFITLEDETGVANLILWPDFFQDNRVVVMSEPFLLAEGVVQKQDGVIHVKVEQLKPAGKLTLEMESHDFH